jgi:hypothetical protein
MHGKALTAAATLVHVSRDRGKEHPNRHLTGWQGILQAEAYGGYNDLYRQDRKPGPVVSALCWAHARRKVFELADITGQYHGAMRATANPAIKSGKELSRRSSGSMQSSTSSVISTDWTPSLVSGRAAVCQPRSSPILRLGYAPNGPRCQEQPRRQSHQLPVREQPLACLHPVSDRRARLPDEQGRRTIPARQHPRPQSLALRRVKLWRQSRHIHVFPNRHCKDEQHRPASLARRCPRQNARIDGLPIARTSAMELAQRILMPKSSLTTGMRRMLTKTSTMQMDKLQ